MNNTIQLTDKEPVAKSGEKIVYLHPEDDNKLIKVISPRYVDYLKNNQSITSRLRRFTYYWFFSNMVAEHIASREWDIDKKHYLQRILGFEDTDMGLGIVVDAIKKEDGTLSDTLRDILEQSNYSAAHKQVLDDFIAWMKVTHIIIRDLSLDNLVWNESGKHFVLVDGIGGRYLPSLRAYWPHYNLRGNRKRAEKLQYRIDKFLDR